MSGVEDATGRLNTTLYHDLNDKFEVPLNTSLQCRLEWLAGYLDADGSVARNGTNEALQVCSINYEFLKNVQSLLITMGVQSKVNQLFGERKAMLPDGHGGYASFDCQPLWRLLVSSSGLYHLSTLGFKTHRLKWVARKPQRNAEQFAVVLSVISRGRHDDTYCFNEPLNHAGIFNGILTGNCTEILEYSSPEETAVCNLASLALPSFVRLQASGFRYDFDSMRKAVKVAVRNLDRVIDINFYPTPETERSNMRHRPIGLGVQGLADVFAMLGIAWESAAAADLNQRIFEHIYFAAVEESSAIAAVKGAYSTFAGSPASKGLLQPDLWVQDGQGVVPITDADGTLDWAKLRSDATKGLRNSLLVAPMPTASTSQILGFNECFEPFTTNIYTRRTLAGEFIVINKHLVKELIDLGKWNDAMKQSIIINNGSVQALELPDDLKARYKTSWEIPQKILIDMAAARGAFICQSQSLNLFMADPNYAKLTSMHFYAWKKGLKTGCYYLRTKAPVAAQKFTVDPRLTSSGAVPNDMGSDSEEDEPKASVALQKVEAPKPETREELKARLAREYEEEEAKGCVACSS
jgi:ribonucleoside-diphosphate reductase alpha chain